MITQLKELLDNAPPYVLLVEDELDTAQQLLRSLGRRELPCEFLHAATAERAVALAEQYRPSVAVVDLSLSPDAGPEGGLSLATSLLRFDPTIRIVVLTGHTGREIGIRALNHGAASFLTKPADMDHLAAIIKDGILVSLLKRTQTSESRVPSAVARSTGLTSRNSAMAKCIDDIAFAAQTTQPVLLLGETGTGKTMIAQAVHRASTRRRAPFIRFQPTFRSADLVSSELFGHERGAFTGALESKRGLLEEVDGGTLFIDEVDELPIETQVLLLHVLQEKSFRKVGGTKQLQSNFRLIAASNRPLEELTRGGKLRQDFFHRIAHFTIPLPALRERPEDILDLARERLLALADEEDLELAGLSAAAGTKLLDYRWPGNIRELHAVVTAAAFRATIAGRSVIEPVDISHEAVETSPITAAHGSFRHRVQKFEEELVEQALRECEGNQTRAAAMLQLDRTSFRRVLSRIVK